jgi:hypothetical protein
MKEIEARSTVQSAEETAGASKSRKSQSLRLDKQTIRTLTGAELKLVGGGCGDCSCGCHSQANTTK